MKLTNAIRNLQAHKHCAGDKLSLAVLLIALSLSTGWTFSVGAQPAQPAPGGVPPNQNYQVVYEIKDSTLVVNVPTSTTRPTSVQQDGADLLLSFKLPIQSIDAQTLLSRTTPFIIGVNAGYDSLLLRVAPGVRVSAANTATQIALKFERGGSLDNEGVRQNAGIGGPPTDSPGALRLRLMRGHLMLINDELSQARGRFSSLRAVMQNQVEPIVGLAEVELQAGNWRKSLAYYREAAAIKGETAEINERRRTIERTQASHGTVGFEVRRSQGGTSSPVVVRQADARAIQRINEQWRFNVELESAQVRADLVQSQQGLFEPYSGRHTRGMITAQHDDFEGSVTAASIYLGNQTPGIGISYTNPDDRGSTHIKIEFRRDNWDYVEGFVVGAMRDRFAVGRTHRIAPGVKGRVEIGANRYHNEDIGSLGRSATVSAELRINNLVSTQGLSVAYNVNGEYFSNVTNGISQTGTEHQYLPLVNREVHSITMGYFQQFYFDSKAKLIFDGFVGVGKDRYGQSGEVGGVSLAYVQGPVEISLGLNHVRNVARTPGSANAISALLTVYF
jgi:hypothetical protein